VGLPDLIDDERFTTSPKRTVHHAELEPLIVAAMRTRTTKEWLDELIAVGIPCGPVNTVPQMLEDEQVKSRGIVKEVTHHIAGTIAIADSPVRMSRSETGIKGPPPDLGQDTAEVLGSLLGMSEGEVEALAKRGVVATSGGPDIGAITR
jgi:crotonobetainyl-CoA:carnitine CoA-transferase CaiB-like acyl-CoA transferase